jgi:hypothetical protein
MPDFTLSRLIEGGLMVIDPDKVFHFQADSAVVLVYRHVEGQNSQVIHLTVPQKDGALSIEDIKVEIHTLQ